MLQDLRLLLGLEDDDTGLDTKLALLLSSATARLKLLLGGIDPPEEMRPIIVEATASRFNRLGSEGLASHSVEGESMTFTDGDFDAYKEEIQAFLDAQKASIRGRVRFL